MKKYLFLAVAAVVTIAGCTKVNEFDAPKKEITFEVAKRIQTKADTGAKYSTTSTFGTYAWFTAASGSDHAEFMVNEKVGFDGSVWKTSDHTFYWPKTGGIDFISYSPFEGTSNTAGTVPAVTQDHITYTGYTAGTTDIMYADKVVGLSANVNEIQDNLDGGADSGYSGVPTLFRHALAKVNFKIKANFVEWTDPLDASIKTSWKVTAKSVKISGLRTTGDCDLVLNADGKTWKLPVTRSNSVDYNVWSNPSGATAEQELITGAGVVLTTVAQDIAPAAGYVLPQILGNNKQKITLVFDIETTLANGKTIIENDVTKTYDIKAISSIQAWQINENIVYTINIKPTAKADGASGHDDDPEDVIITFDPAVADWVTVDSNVTIQL